MCVCLRLFSCADEDQSQITVCVCMYMYMYAYINIQMGLRCWRYIHKSMCMYVCMYACPSVTNTKQTQMLTLKYTFETQLLASQIHEFHLWSLNTSTFLCTVHIVVQTESTQDVNRIGIEYIHMHTYI